MFFQLIALPVPMPRQVSKRFVFRLVFDSRFGSVSASIFRRFSGSKSQENSSKNRVFFLILFASGFLSFFRGPNLENRRFSIVKRRFSRNLRFRFSPFFRSKSVSVFDDFCHEKSVKTDLKNTRAFLRRFSHFLRRFGLSFWTLEGAKRGEKRRMAARRVPEGFWEPFWTPFWVDLGALGAPLGAIWSLWGLSWDSFWPPGSL